MCSTACGSCALGYAASHSIDKHGEGRFALHYAAPDGSEGVLECALVMMVRCWDLTYCARRPR
jgi:hypothetical protein